MDTDNTEETVAHLLANQSIALQDEPNLTYTSDFFQIQQGHSSIAENDEIENDTINKDPALTLNDNERLIGDALSLTSQYNSSLNALSDILPLRKAVPEHVDHDHNLAKNLISNQSSSFLILNTTGTVQEEHQRLVPLHPKEIYVTDNANQVFQDNSQPTTTDQTLRQLILLGNLNHVNESVEAKENSNLIPESEVEGYHHGSEEIEIVIEPQPPISVTRRRRLNSKGLKKINSTVRTNVSHVSRTINIPIHGGGSVSIQRFIFSNSLCRVCLLLKENVLSVFEDVNIASDRREGNSRGSNASNLYSMSSALKTLLDIDVNFDHGLPIMICIDCIDRIMSFSAFRKRIGVGQTRLLHILSQVKNSLHPTVIPALGEEENGKVEVLYRHSGLIVEAKKTLNNSMYSHLVDRNIPDKVWETIFSSMVIMMGFKSAKLKELEPYVMLQPFVKAWFCSTCNLTFHGSQDVYVQHCLSFHGTEDEADVRFPCDICGLNLYKRQSSGVEESYCEHWLQHFFFHECNICLKKLPSVKSVWVHKRSAHSSSHLLLPINECGVCHKKFKKKHHLAAHTKIHLNPEEREKHLTKCHLCHKCLTGSLTAHISAVHTDERPWKCETCLKCFKRKETLQGHRDTVHLNTNVKFQCQHCGMHFKSSSTKKSHEFRHNGEKLHKCDLCTLKFFTRSSLRSHAISHKGRDISCTLCNKKFKRKTYLTEHMRIHSDEKPFECHICKRKIRIRANYYKHLKVHKKNGSYTKIITNEKGDMEGIVGTAC